MKRRKCKGCNGLRPLSAYDSSIFTKDKISAYCKLCSSNQLNDYLGKPRDLPDEEDDE